MLHYSLFSAPTSIVYSTCALDFYQQGRMKKNGITIRSVFLDHVSINSSLSIVFDVFSLARIFIMPWFLLHFIYKCVPYVMHFTLCLIYLRST